MKDYSPERLDPTQDDNLSRIAAHQYRYDFAKDLLAEEKRELKILDIACGVGYGSDTLSEIPNTKVYGVDISDEAIDTAKNRYRKKNIEFQAGSLTDIPFGDGYFDAVVCFETIEHIMSGDSNKALMELNRVLNKSGLLIISTPNKLVEDIAKYVFRIDNKYHSNELGYGQLKDGLVKCGFDILGSFGQGLLLLPLYPLVKRKLFPTWYFKPSNLFPPSVSMFMIVLCKKNQ